MGLVLRLSVAAMLAFVSTTTGAEESLTVRLLEAEAMREAAIEIAECALLADSAPTRFDEAQREAMMGEALRVLTEAGAAHIAAAPLRYGNAGLDRMPPEFFAGYFFRTAQERMLGALLRNGAVSEIEAFADVAVARFDELACDGWF